MSNDVTVQRLEDQIAWYDRKSAEAQKWFKRLKLAEIILGAFIPFAAGVDVSALLTGLLGVSVVVMESVQHLYQFQSNWTSYRSTCESLKHEKFLFLAKAGPYACDKDPLVLLAERIEEIVSKEHAKWVSERKHHQVSGSKTNTPGA